MARQTNRHPSRRDSPIRAAVVVLLRCPCQLYRMCIRGQNPVRRSLRSKNHLCLHFRDSITGTSSGNSTSPTTSRSRRPSSMPSRWKCISAQAITNSLWRGWWRDAVGGPSRKDTRNVTSHGLKSKFQTSSEIKRKTKTRGRLFKGLKTRNKTKSWMVLTLSYGKNTSRITVGSKTNSTNKWPTVRSTSRKTTSSRSTNSNCTFTTTSKIITLLATKKHYFIRWASITNWPSRTYLTICQWHSTLSRDWTTRPIWSSWTTSTKGPK